MHGKSPKRKKNKTKEDLAKGLPEKSNQSSPRSFSGMPPSTSSRVLDVLYMQTPRPNSEKWMFHASSFIFSFI